MKPRRLYLKEAIVLFLFVALGFWGQCGYADESVTNEKLYELLGARAHNVSKDQLGRLEKILDSFLTGDPQGIARSLDRMKYDIDRMNSKFSPPPGANIDQVEALKKIDEEAELLRIAAVGEDYEEAYRHFTRITLVCIQCHEAKRQWGTFEDPPKAVSSGQSRGAVTAVVRDASAAKKTTSSSSTTPPAKLKKSTELEAARPRSL